MKIRRWWTAAALAIVLAAGLLPGLARFVPVAEVEPAAAANPGDRFLQVMPESQGGGLGATLVLTARLFREGGTSPTGVPGFPCLPAPNLVCPPEPAPADNASGRIPIDFELEGTGALNTDGNTPETSDTSCIIQIGSHECRVVIQSQTAGSYNVRAWIDADEKDQAPAGVLCTPLTTQCGVTEADRSEGRLASATPYPANDADCYGTDNGDSDEGACATGDEQPGAVAEPDNTDVVEVRWGSGSTLLDCVSARDGGEVDGRRAGTDGPGDPGQIRCLVVDGNGAPRAGANIDAENLNGANDPDNAGFGAAGNETADYDSPGASGGEILPGIPPGSEPSESFCTTDANGRCTASIPQSEAQTGPADICFWIDEGEPDNQFNSSDAGDGSGCGEPILPDDADGADVVRVLWETPRPSGVDARPDTQQVSPGQPVTITATAYDQFGDPFLSGADVALEWFLGSRRDGDGNSPSTPDRACRTATTGSNPPPGSCTIQYSQSDAGTDLMCVYLPPLADSQMTGDQNSGTCSGEGLADPTGEDTRPSPGTDKVDVVRVVWQVSGPENPNPTPSRRSGYWFTASDGGIFAFGDAPFRGSTGNIRLNRPVVGMAATPSNNGYWLVANDGGIFAFGDAVFRGSTGNITLNQPVVGMAETHTGNGYWMVARDGGIFAFGDASFRGSTGNIKLNQPVVGMARTPNSQGYWMVASDGGIFAFGNAPFRGSTGNIKLNQPIVGMAPTSTGQGYWMVASDGGIFAFGDARFHGSAGNLRLNSPIVGMIPTSTGGGYWLVAADGGVFSYGDATFKGSTGNIKLNQPIVGGDGF